MPDDIDLEDLWEEEEEEEEGDEEEQEDDESEGSDDDGTDDGQSDDGDDDAPLGPKGEKALQAEKQKRRDAQKELREWKALGLSAADIKKLVDERKDSDGKPDADTIRQQIRAEVDAEVLETRVLDKIEAKASRLFADPDDAAALVMRGRDADEFLDDGKVDVEAIQDALDELLEKKPYLAAQGGRRFQGSADGGTRKESRTKQLSRTDLARMSPQEIEKARQDGKLDDLLSGKKS